MILRPVLLGTADFSQTPGIDRGWIQSRLAQDALTRCASLCGAPNSGWEKDASGAPKPNAGFFWSVSHTRGMVGAVVSKEPIGIDIEIIRPRREGLFKHVATPAEWRMIDGAGWDAFYTLWTAKEAVVKACGRGVGWVSECVLEKAAAAQLNLTFEGRRWSVTIYRVGDHVAAVTARAHEIQWIVIPDR